MRVALGVTPTTIAEVVAAVTALRSRPDVQLVAPALDRRAVESTLATALGEEAAAVTIEQAHEYLARGHDAVVGVGDDPAERGRALAEVLDGRAPTAHAARTPSEVIAWLAVATELSIPDVLVPDGGPVTPIAADDTSRVLVRTPWTDGVVAVSLLDGGAPALGTLYDPGEVRWLAHVLRAGDVLVDLAPGVGIVAIHAARLVGASGIVVLAEQEEERRTQLRTNADLNGVHGRVVVEDDAARAADRARASGETIAVARVGSSTERLDVLAPLIEDGTVEHLTLEVGGSRDTTSEVVPILDGQRRRLGAAFAVLDVDGRAQPVDVTQLPSLSEPRTVVVSLSKRRR